MRNASRLVALGAVAALAASPLAAQYSQYIAPGSAARSARIDAAQAMRGAAEAARWHLGPLAIDPVFELREVAWIDPGGEIEGDLTASAAAGLRAYLPIGNRLMWTAHLVPEYIWWRERSEDRRLAGRAGLGLQVAANRFLLEILASSSDWDGYLTSEIDERAEIEERGLQARLEVPILRTVSIFVSGAKSNSKARGLFESPTDELRDLDRKETWIEGGLRWWVTPELSLGVGVGRTETIFEDAARDRSNDGTTLVADLSWARPKTSVGLSVRKSDLEGTPGSEFGFFRGSTGTARVNWTPRDRFSFGLYGLRNLTYTVLADGPYFVDVRIGVELGLPIGRRGALVLFHEQGENRFEGLGLDDTSSSGASLTFSIRRLELRVGGRRTDSDGFTGERSFTQLTFGFAIGKFRGVWY